MRVLVTGAAGQLGSELTRLLPLAVGFNHRELSITDRGALERAFLEHRPEVVFNCAAYNAVDRAESEAEIAHQVNAVGPGVVAALCREQGIRLVHFSTNFVFDGFLDRPYIESDQARPLGVYGKSKLEGEAAVLGAMPQALVIRTAAVFGDRGSAIKGGSFPGRILERAGRGERLRVVSDQRVNPTYARDLAKAAIALEATRIDGVVHVVASGCCSWNEFARAALLLGGVNAEVEAVSTSELGAPASRPLNGCLASTRTEPLRPWQEGLAEWAAGQAAGSAP